MKYYFLFSALLISGILTGCDMYQSTSSSPAETVSEPPFDQYRLFPEAKDKSIFQLDLDGDGINEIAATYTQHIEARKSTYHAVKYLDVKRMDKNGQWYSLKQDQVTTDGAATAADFCGIKVTDVGGDNKNELLTVKCDVTLHSRIKGYSLFGQVAEGKFDDFAIPKAYLHEQEYLGTNENYMQLLKVNVDTSGITETYGVHCAGEDVGGIDAGSDKEFCRAFDHHIPFRTATNGFDDTEGRENEKILSQFEYFIHDQHVWHKDNFQQEKKIVEKPISELVPPSPYGDFFPSELHQVTSNGKTYLFLTAGGGCGGCIYLDPHVIVIDTKDNSVRIEEAPKDRIVYETRCIAEVKVSWDGKKMVCVESTVREDNPEHRQQTLWLYDFLTHEEKELFTVPDDQHIGPLDCYGICPGSFRWIFSEKIEMTLYPLSGEDKPTQVKISI